MMTNPYTNIYFLGGLEEVGKNCYCIEHEDEIIMFDCGIKMPGVTSYGFDHIIPNFNHIIRNKDKLVGIFITHGHEDHIGALSYLIKEVYPVKIYSPRIAIELIERKLNEKKVPKTHYKIILVNDGFKLRTKHFFIEPYNMVHSIPDTYGFFITTPNGIVSTTADFRFDLTPLGPITNFHKITEYSKKGCTVLLSDSTNSLISGFTKSESQIMLNIDSVISNCKTRLIISAFSSNIYRLQEIVKLAIKYGRKILIYGRSMDRNIQASIKLNYINLKDFKLVFIKAADAKKYPAEKILILCTGSQGETMSTLDRISNGKHQQVSIKKGDTVVFSSSPIPGNFLQVEVLVNKLSKLGANVIQNTPEFALHTSGHATQNEQKLMFALLKPKYFVPMHGEYNMLLQHTKTAKIMGIEEKNSFICKNGDIVSLNKGLAFKNGYVESGVVYIEGNSSISQSNDIIYDRNVLINHGMVSVIYTVNHEGKKLKLNPIIISRGTFYVKENGKLIYQLQMLLGEKINNILSKSKYKEYKKLVVRKIRDEVKGIAKEFIYKRKKRYPYILVVNLDENKITN